MAGRELLLPAGAHGQGAGVCCPISIPLPTGYVKNHFSIGPFHFVGAFSLDDSHHVVLGLDHLGVHIPADGYSSPYLVTMAVATALYGFAGLLLAFDLARHYVEDRWALLATVGIWCGSSLPVYMYFNPSWSHAHSAFCRLPVPLVLAPDTRSKNFTGVVAFRVVRGADDQCLLSKRDPAAGSWARKLSEIITALSNPRRVSTTNLLRPFGAYIAFASVTLVSLLPTFAVHHIIYGSALDTDYPPLRSWSWTSPVLLRVLFSADHGMLSWTPILIPAVCGLVLLISRDRVFGTGLLLSFLAYYYFIASYPDWDGISSFGNRFFVSLTPLFVIGLATFLDFLTRKWPYAERHVAVPALAIGLFILWNGSFILQWGTNMVPTRGPISWNVMIRNQYDVVPRRIAGELQTYFSGRKAMMQHIEERDGKQLESH